MEIYPEADTKPEADVLETPTIAGEVVTDGENSKAGKKRAKAPWAKLLCQYSQNPTLYHERPSQRSIDCNYGDIESDKVRACYQSYRKTVNRDFSSSAEEIIIPSVQFSYTQFLNNGNFVGAASGKTFPALDTRTKEVIANVAEGDAEDINRAMKAARKSIDEGAWP
ncbi:unnamed protein product [Brassica rapa subsp. narinosa]